ALAARGISLLVSVRHADEIPSCVTDVMTIENGRITQISRNAPPTSPAHMPRRPSRIPVKRADSGADLPPVVEIRDLKISFGRRKLFDGLTWVVRKGERWVLRGANGSGKTTLLSLVIGDNPQAYANDVTVFGQKRGPGMELAKIRRRIGMVSPELQAYTGETAEELLEAALKRKPSLLLLDEPCLNLDERAAEKLKRRVDTWLKTHRDCTAICVAHRPEDVPPDFPHMLALS
ncbi:MAG: ATP-binding cassette domain-containing protein, partial [bacterium]|nr:ATP-binding cassette domain-containing protein [bacterium]